MEGLRRIENSDVVGALDIIQDRFCMAVRLNHHPFLADCLIQHDICMQNIILIEQVLNHGTMKEEFLDKLDTIIKSYLSSQMIDDVYRNELPFRLVWLKNSLVFTQGNNIYWTIIIQSNTEECLDILDEMVAICSMNRTLWFSKIMKIQQRGNVMGSFFHPITISQIISLTDNLVMDLRVGAQIDTARVAIAVERYRLVTGKLPDCLEDLVPKFMERVLIDPFDGNPLRYKRIEKDYTIYSVGKNSTDDGGTILYDYPFTVRR